MAAFSRWQLAAALLEYDNDPDNFNAPRRSAQDSAIFAPIRKANATIRDLNQPPPHSPNLLGVKLPSESGLPSDAGGGDTRRRSKASVDLLHNPFGADEEELEEEEELEVDLASWGLDSLMSEEKPSKKSKGAKGKAKSDTLTHTVGVGSRPRASRPTHGRAMSVPLAEFGEGGAFLDSNPRRNTISDPINMEEMGMLGKSGERQRLSSHPLIENLPVRAPLHSLSSYEHGRDTVPFPSSSSMPGQSEANVPDSSRPASRLNVISDEEPNPFAVPPPPPSRASRFDPKYAAHARTMSNATRLSVGTQLAYDHEEDQNGRSYPAPSRASILDARTTRDRRISAASFGTRDMLEDDFQSAYGEEYPPRERRYSRLELMRPKVLVMPSPLQTRVMVLASAPKVTRTKEGFLDSSDDRPLPPGARASRMSMLAPSSVPVPVNSFTPNPRLSLSAAQLLFRNTLLVDGQKDVSYNDIDGNLQRATEDGEQVKFEMPEEPERSAITVPDAAALAEEAKWSRPPGKLFGRSLIDDLEARKQEMRNKQRVFTGDQRPSMMARTALNRSSTLIDPSTLPRRPTASRMPSTQPGASLVRRGSRGSKPLLAIDDNGQIAETGEPHDLRMAQTRSVFGVDKLWEREMVKLKEIEAQEKIEEEERREREEEEEKKERKAKKKKGVRREKGDELSPSPSSPAVSSSVSPQPASPRPEPIPEPVLSLALPDIPTVTSRRRPVPVPADDESDNESSASEAPNQNAALQEDLVDQWVSDDEKKRASASNNVPAHPRINVPSDDDSDEDVPLSVTLQRATQKLAGPARSQPEDDDSDEDRPLSMMLLNKASLTSFNIPSSSMSDPTSKSHENGKGGDDDDDDNVPLGVRASRLPLGASQLSGLSALSAGGDNDEDNRPLSMHPAQIRKSQFQMFAQMQQQQQQQQRMLQAQMTNSMMFPHPPSMMFMMPPAAAPPPLVSQPPAIQDVNKFSSVDRWRRDVAIEQS